MKTTLNVLSVIAKVLVAIFAVIGVMMSAVTIISTKVFVDHVNDILDEDIDKDAIEIASEACGRAVTDEGLMENPIVLFTSKVIAPIVHPFVKF